MRWTITTRTMATSTSKGPSKVSPGQFRSRKKAFERPVLIRALYKSRLEDKLAAQLESAGHSFDYEKLKLKYEVPARQATYTPDFDLGNGVIIEAKGWLQTADRTKMIHVKRDHPELDIRFVFSGNPTKKPIYKGSPTSYAKWCEDHGFPWAGNGTIPEAWLTPATTH
jgi:hypothetical protein